MYCTNESDEMDVWCIYIGPIICKRLLNVFVWLQQFKTLVKVWLFHKPLRDSYTEGENFCTQQLINHSMSCNDFTKG